jgi:hypothetical protein
VSLPVAKKTGKANKKRKKVKVALLGQDDTPFMSPRKFAA